MPRFLPKTSLGRRLLFFLMTAAVILGCLIWDVNRPPHHEASMMPGIEVLGPPKLVANGLTSADLDRLTTTICDPALFTTAVAKTRAQNPAFKSCHVEAFWRSSVNSHHPGSAQVVGDNAAFVSAVSDSWAEEINRQYRSDPLVIENGLKVQVHCAAIQATPYESSWAVRFSSGSLNWQEEACDWLKPLNWLFVSRKQHGQGC
jgi:hypothetical protein